MGLRGQPVPPLLRVAEEGTRLRDGRLEVGVRRSAI